MRASDLALHLTEAQFQDKVIDLAHARGWLVHHVRPARTPDGKYLTRIAGDRGFPDLVLVRGGSVIFAELKTETGRLSPSQKTWLFELTSYEEPGCDPSHEVRVWRPSDWQEIEQVLA